MSVLGLGEIVTFHLQLTATGEIQAIYLMKIGLITKILLLKFRRTATWKISTMHILLSHWFKVHY